MNTDLFLLVGRRKLKLLYCQNKVDIREYEHENNTHIPFYFYSNNNGDILLGESAKNKFKNLDKDAYHNYFDLIKNVNKKFSFFGEKQKIDKIIVRATEYIINEFLKNVLFSDETVYDLKEKLNISLIFYNDVSENEITFVNSVFIKEGYKKIKSFYYNYLLLNFLDKNRKIGSFKGYIIADSIDNNLHLNYFDDLNRKQYKNNAIGKNLAVDPKMKLLGSTIINLAIEKSRSLVNPDDEAKKHEAIFKEAYKKYNIKPEFSIHITLSDGAEATVKIKKSRIRDKLTFAGEFTKDFSFLDHFYDKTGIQQSEMIFILHKDIHSDNFSEKIKSNYTNVYHSTELSSEIFQLFYKNINCANNGNLTSNNIESNTKPKLPSNLVDEHKNINIKQTPEISVKSTAKHSEIKKVKTVSSKTKTAPSAPPPPPSRRPSAPPRPPRPPRKPSASKNINQTTSLSSKPKNIKNKNDVSVKKIVNLSPPPLPEKKAQNSSIKRKKNIRRPSVPPPPPMPKK
jgi:hypothetical protein